MAEPRDESTAPAQETEGGELRECPFCGMRQAVRQTGSRPIFRAQEAWVKCLVCGAESARDIDLGACIKAWNRRSTSVDVEKCRHKWRVLIGGIRCDLCGEQIAARDERASVDVEKIAEEGELVEHFATIRVDDPFAWTGAPPRLVIDNFGRVWIEDHFDALVTLLRRSLTGETPRAQEWIPVDVRLPEPLTCVAAWIGSTSIYRVAIITPEGQWMLPERNLEGREAVTHWTPLPEPPATLTGETER